MKISPIFASKQYNFRYKTQVCEHNSSELQNYSSANKIAPNYFNISFGLRPVAKKDFELYFSEKELEKRTSLENLFLYKMLDIDAKEYKNLSRNDKITLKYLVKAANCFDSVYKALDNVHNLEFENYLHKESALGNKSAIMTQKLYDAQKGIFANEVSGKPISLVKDLESPLGKGFYPEDLSVEEFHQILLRMLKNGADDEVKQILNQRSVVVRDGENLKAIDYTERFKKEFTNAAYYLTKASEYSQDKDFKEYLLLQAIALVQNNVWADCAADKKWATLQNTTLEFTIGRECYSDKMTPTVASNKELQALLDDRGIKYYAKDNIGCRVGIVDKDRTKYLLKIKDYLPFIASKMPYSYQYEQNIKVSNQTMLDADIVTLTGHNGAFRGGISLASNLPNGDKLAVQTGGGHRTVYHKQVRYAKYSDKIQEKLDVLLNKRFHQYFSPQALLDFTILHENLHSLGPKNGLEALGVYKTIIEEHKADVGAIVMLDELTQIGFYSKQQQKEILTSLLFGYVRTGPDFGNAHATRNILQYNYFIQNKAINFDDKGCMQIDFDKVTQCAKEMLDNSIKIQLGQSSQMAKEYIDKYAVWTPDLQSLADKLNSINLPLNAVVKTPLADRLA